ncbi:tctex1 domain-containing protein 3-like [Orussus abietinus]|uniref:tctex1 domain-containing protein 3-like n=1 Tax=Orussus abietinus TaxID=222816 RepID=UPI000626E40E|nr:tctex1 domain-containing protein 3-like [Orussus abietinus]
MAQPEGADGSDQVEQVKVYENSYRMEPNNRYSAEVVDKIIFEVMNLQLEDFVYDPEVHNGANLCSDIAAEIRKRILKKKFDRYKVVVGVSIVERQSQTFESVLGFLWDVSRDNYSTYTYTSKTFSATCFVVGAYYE